MSRRLRASRRKRVLLPIACVLLLAMMIATGLSIDIYNGPPQLALRCAKTDVECLSFGRALPPPEPRTYVALITLSLVTLGACAAIIVWRLRDDPRRRELESEADRVLTG